MVKAWMPVIWGSAEPQIKQYEFILSKIPDEYNMLCEWSAIREKEIYFIRKIVYLKKLSKERELNDKKYKASVVIKKWEDESKQLGASLRILYQNTTVVIAWWTTSGGSLFMYYS